MSLDTSVRLANLQKALSHFGVKSWEEVEKITNIKEIIAAPLEILDFEILDKPVKGIRRRCP